MDSDANRSAREILFEHRRQVRALIATLRAIVRRTSSTERPVAEFAALLEGRIGALARVQEMLMRIDGCAELTEVVSAEFLAQGIAEQQVDMSGGPVQLSSRVAGSLALAIHELTSNAIQHGALSAPEGRVAVSWEQDPAWGSIQLTWRETGMPVLSDAPRRTGFGLELLENTLPYEVGARTRVEFFPGGLRCEIEFHPRGRHLSAHLQDEERS